MRLDYLELCGFRGFLERQRVDFGTGFTVICGRNGVGKSTLLRMVAGLLQFGTKWLSQMLF